MKFLYSAFWVIILAGTVILAQQTGKTNRNDTADWSALFPVIAGCRRDVRSLKQAGRVFEQTAIYQREGYESNKNYTPCGSITLRFEPFARKTARKKTDTFFFLTNVPTKVKGFEAYQSSPLCGLDTWRGSTTVYFDEDKALIADANAGGEKILEFTQNADYGWLRKSLNKLVRGKINQNKSETPAER